MGGLREERRDGVVTLSRDRPERRNAIDVPLWHALPRALLEVAERDEDRVVVLTGTGDTFCTGGNLDGAVGSRGPTD